VGSLRLVVADDHPVWRAGVGPTLGEGFEVVAQAEDAPGAVQAIRSEAPDLALVDLHMPGGGGIAVVETCAALCPIVICTVSNAERDLLDAVAVGAVGYLLKTSTPEELQVACRTAASGEPVFSPTLAALVMGEFRRMAKASEPADVDLLKPILAEIDADMTIRRPTTDAEVIEMAKDADGIIMHGSVPLSREIISQIKRVKVVCRTGVGVDRMDLKAAADHGLIICNAAGCNSIEVAEQAIGLMIAISRKLVRMNQYVHDGKWKRHTAELHAYRGRVYRIQGCTMGIVGLGHVGKQVAPASSAPQTRQRRPTADHSGTSP
jgi:DNA-binding NarL/FixJ family response regulator